MNFTSLLSICFLRCPSLPLQKIITYLQLCTVPTKQGMSICQKCFLHSYLTWTTVQRLWNPQPGTHNRRGKATPPFLKIKSANSSQNSVIVTLQKDHLVSHQAPQTFKVPYSSLKSKPLFRKVPWCQNMQALYKRRCQLHKDPWKSTPTKFCLFKTFSNLSKIPLLFITSHFVAFCSLMSLVSTLFPRRFVSGHSSFGKYLTHRLTPGCKEL